MKNVSPNSQYLRNMKKKEETESILLELSKSCSAIRVDTEKVKSTPVFIGGKRVLNIYYRQRAVRVDIPLSDDRRLLVQELFDRGIAYQKDTANPTAIEGYYSFFVDEDHEREAYEYLLCNG